MPRQELGISFDLFWHKMDFKLAPDVNTVLMSFFLNSFRSLGPRIGTQGSFMMFLVFLILFWSLFFGLLMFRKYSVAILVFAFQYIFCLLLKENLWILPLRYVVLCFSLILSVHLLLMLSRRFRNHKSYYQCWYWKASREQNRFFNWHFHREWT